MSAPRRSPRFVRLYTLVVGRRAAPGVDLRPTTEVVATLPGRGGNEGEPLAAPLWPEEVDIVEQCAEPVSLAALVGAVHLPYGVVRTVVADLVRRGLLDVRVDVTRSDRPAAPRSSDSLEATLANLRAL